LPLNETGYELPNGLFQSGESTGHWHVEEVPAVKIYPLTRLWVREAATDKQELDGIIDPNKTPDKGYSGQRPETL
jgi:hypothetical protein